VVEAFCADTGYPRVRFDAGTLSDPPAIVLSLARTPPS